MREQHLIWIEYCGATENIRERYGTTQALGYLVGEKLLHFLQASEKWPAFAGEVPKFAAEVRKLFEPWEIESYLDNVTRVGAPGHVMDDATYEMARDAGMFEENVVAAAEDVIRMGRIREMLLG